MTAVLVCGAGMGVGILLIVHGLVRTRTPLAVALARLQGAAPRTATRVSLPPARASETDDNGLVSVIGRPVARHLVTLPLIAKRTRCDLVVLDRTPERHLAEKVTLCLTGFLLVPVAVAIMALGGTFLAWEIPVWFAIVLGVGGFVLPDIGMHADAAKRRADFRHALGSFLDLVVIALAGGVGVEGALTDAAGVGQGWAFARLHRALEEANLTRVAPWGPLGRLGDDLGIDELRELAGTVGLAGSEGAKVRATLSAKAASIRAHSLADAQAAAESTTERMSLPVVVLFAGFLLFVGYPAIAHVLTGI
ncbi:MAG TPA: type II secretion system F family protein [Acidimicrobiales bacterium]|nr:type II secretion system F family protein [Acidimicrobiales bacterium]